MTAAVTVDPALLAQRRAAVTRHPTQRGIDRVEVTVGSGGALTLTIVFLSGSGSAADKIPRPDTLAVGNVRISIDDPSAGARPQGYLRVVDVSAPADTPDAVLVDVVSRDARDPSARALTYQVELVDVPTVDPFFAAAPFSMTSVVQAEAPAAGARATAPPGSWPVDYQARDFASLRDLMIDRLAQLMPGWHDTEPADLLHTVVEVLAYAGDHLAYFQDAVATEAYLGTARSRISIRRHARLLDYVVHEGCNARVWLELRLTPGEPVVLPKGTRALTAADTVGPPPTGGSPVIDDGAVLDVVAAGSAVFETVEDNLLDPTLDTLDLYDWGLDGYTLPAGASAAELRGSIAAVAPGAVLILHPATGGRTDDDGLPPITVVRVLAVEQIRDALAGDGLGQPLTRVTWHLDDALGSPLQVSALPGGRPAVARGLVVLADHGRTLGAEPLTGPAGAARFRPRLSNAGLTWREPLPADAAQRSAGSLLRQDARLATPELQVDEWTAEVAPVTWRPTADLLASDRQATDLVVEMEDDGTAQLRFGDGVNGRQVSPGSRLTATYRIGNGESGNVGPGTLTALARPFGSTAPSASDPFTRVTAVTNPLPAACGTTPESTDTVRLIAPQAFTVQQRCAIESDFVTVAERHPQVRRAVATFRWSGSWTSALVVVDRHDGLPVDDALITDLRAWFEPYRLTGGDIDLRGPVPVAVDIAITVGVAAGHRADAVERGLRAAFGTGVAADGTAQFFNPSRFGMGDPLYLSQLIGCAAAVDGVAWAEVIRLQRSGQPAAGELERGVLPVNGHELLRVAPGDVMFVMVDAGDPR